MSNLLFLIMILPPCNGIDYKVGQKVKTAIGISTVVYFYADYEKDNLCRRAVGTFPE